MLSPHPPPTPLGKRQRGTLSHPVVLPLADFAQEGCLSSILYPVTWVSQLGAQKTQLRPLHALSEVQDLPCGLQDSVACRTPQENSSLPLSILPPIPRASLHPHPAPALPDSRPANWQHLCVPPGSPFSGVTFPRHVLLDSAPVQCRTPNHQTRLAGTTQTVTTIICLIFKILCLWLLFS